MPLQILPYTAEHEPLVATFNDRAKAHDAPFLLSKTATAAWLPKSDGAPVFREFFLAIDNGQVRGGFTLRKQDFRIKTAVAPVANYQGPLSEGIWDRRYMMAGVQLLRAALREQPRMYALGMGGLDQPLPKLLASAGWSLEPVPFFFKVLRPASFLRNIQPLRRTKIRAVAADLAAFSGVGFVGIRAAQTLRTSFRPRPLHRCEQVAAFGPWADEVWTKARNGVVFGAVRDRASQEAVFGDGNGRNIILRCDSGTDCIGWVVVRSTAMARDKYFGNMRLGSIVDCLSLPGEESAVVALAEQHLRSLGSDLIVTNQTHSAWRGALSARGFFEGPSNFILACSPEIVRETGPLRDTMRAFHFNRADGDGPIHL